MSEIELDTHARAVVRREIDCFLIFSHRQSILVERGVILTDGMIPNPIASEARDPHIAISHYVFHYGVVITLADEGERRPILTESAAYDGCT